MEDGGTPSGADAMSDADVDDLDATHEVAADAAVSSILDRLRESHGVDFDDYKPATVWRRIQRRAALRRVGSLEEYAAIIDRDSRELEQLQRELLIGVTTFFRDAAAFRYLEEAVIPELVDELRTDDELRVWSVGCSTGEEAYALAMLLLEAFDARQREPRFRVFATDLSRDALRVAAAGIYDAAGIADLDAVRRDAFFLDDGNGRVRVSPRLRKHIVFSVHDALRDAPFTRIDLVSCRNFLIYLRPYAQRRVLANCHFGLRRGGYLFVGQSEGAAGLEDHLELVSQEARVFRRVGTGRVRVERQHMPGPRLVRNTPTRGVPPLAPLYDELLARFVPAGVLVNEQGELVHAFGEVDKYLRPPKGRASHDVASMVRGSLRTALTTALRAVFERGEKATVSSVIDEAGEEPLDVVAEPMRARIASGAFALVRFLPRQATAPVSDPGVHIELTSEVGERVAVLERELLDARATLEATVEQLASSNEALQASNEALVASNEELQSTNEELHSVNEELYSINAEHEAKIRELHDTTTDLSNLMHATEIGTIFLDREHRIRLFTPTAAGVFNLMPQDLGRDLRHITSRIPDDDVFLEVAEVIETGEVRERNLLAPDGRTYLRRIRPYRQDDGSVSGLVLTFVDVTALARAEQEILAMNAELEARVRARTEALDLANVSLREALAKANDLYDNAPCAYHSIDRDGRIVEVNETELRWLGYTREEMLSMTLTDLYTPESVARTAVLSARFRAGGVTIADLEVDIVRKDGTVLPVMVNAVPVLDAEGQYLRSRTSLFDITKRRAVEFEVRRLNAELEERVALRTAEAGEIETRFRQLANDVPALVWLADADGSRTFFNSTWYTFTGQSSESALGSAWVERVHEDDRAEFLRAYRAALLAHAGFEKEYRVRHTDGSTRWLYARAMPRFVGDEFRGLVGCCFDVTRARELREEERRIDQKVQEAAKLESLGVLAGGIAHDFNNILTGILANVSMMETDLPNDSFIRDCCRDIHVASLRASELCRQMLAYSGRGQFVLSNVDLGDLIRDTTRLIRASIGKGVSLRFELEPSLPWTKADIAQIRQVVMNLVINASEAIGTGTGSIILRTGTISARERPSLGEAVFLEVIDDGCGIPAANVARIFDPFFTTKFTGRGLGLAAVQGIVRGHGGTLTVHSVEGEGTRFRMELPCLGHPDHQIESERTTTRFAKGTGLILVIDDEEAVRAVAHRVLTKAGYTTALARDGREGIAMFEANPDGFRAVLLDLTMPGLDGAATLAALRRIKSDVRVLLVSGFGESDVGSRLTTDQPSGFLQKPFDRASLLAAVHKIFL